MRLKVKEVVADIFESPKLKTEMKQVTLIILLQLVGPSISQQQSLLHCRWLIG